MAEKKNPVFVIFLKNKNTIIIIITKDFTFYIRRRFTPIAY